MDGRQSNRLSCSRVNSTSFLAPNRRNIPSACSSRVRAGSGKTLQVQQQAIRLERPFEDRQRRVVPAG